MNDHFEKNRQLWDNWAEIHKDSKFYDVIGFKKTKNSLRPLECKELGNVTDKNLLHLQCHFGMDTLSWAQLGANVVGVDFSSQAIKIANSLRYELNIPAEFICCNVYDLSARLKNRFDIVYTSYGVLIWLPDLTKWARCIYDCLVPGGKFYILEFHPLSYMLDDTGTQLDFPYFNTKEPIIEEQVGSYAEPQHSMINESREWPHSISEIINALIDVGLTIKFLHEFDYSSYNFRPFLTKRTEFEYVFKGSNAAVPLMFSISAVKSE